MIDRPSYPKMFWRRLLSYHRNSKARRSLQHALRGEPSDLRLIIGASATTMNGWISTEYPIVDIADASNLFNWFRAGSVTAMLAEHVWEHLTAEQARIAANHAYKLLKPGGYIRIAVPDGNHPDQGYICDVMPGGSGPGAIDHKVLYNIETLTRLFEACGFQVKPLEWFDNDGIFHEQPWDVGDGMIIRSRRYDPRNIERPLSFTSLIIDAHKCA
jgi:predicted SAM-dependent methyltransferase